MYETYTVKPGDTLYGISRKFNTTVNELISLNNLIDTNLSIGQEIKLPDKEIVTDYEIYEVMEGDSLYKIANKYNIMVSDLIDYNGLPTTIITVGDIIRIPKNKVNGKENVYVVKPGDSLYKIANLYNVSINDLVATNNLTSSILSIGQELIIPIKPVTEEDYVVYKVLPNDTLYSISKRFNTKVDVIKSFNNLTSNNLSIGEILQIPINNTEYVYQTYKIVPGDTLYSIARRYNTTVDKILALNNDISSNLMIGQVIKIPQ